MGISILLPARNEENTIRESILKLDNLLRKYFRDYEIIVIDDASTDNTRKIVREIRIKHLKLIHFNNRNGKGRSVAIGIKRAKAKKVIFIDVDLQGFESISKIYSLLDRCDIVVGNRYLKKSKTKREFSRLIASKIYNFLIKLLFKSRIDDHQCGLKGFKKSKKLMNLLNNVKATHWFWDTELLVKAQWREFKICEVPVKWKEGKESHVRILRDSISILKDIFRLLVER